MKVCMKIYTPPPYREGSKIIRKYTEDFVDPIGNKASIDYVDYTNARGKLIERFEMYIKWDKYHKIAP